MVEEAEALLLREGEGSGRAGLGQTDRTLQDPGVVSRRPQRDRRQPNMYGDWYMGR